MNELDWDGLQDMDYAVMKQVIAGGKSTRGALTLSGGWSDAMGVTSCSGAPFFTRLLEKQLGFFL